jgi:hypothetical protein
MQENTAIQLERRIESNRPSHSRQAKLITVQRQRVHGTGVHVQTAIKAMIMEVDDFFSLWLTRLFAAHRAITGSGT